MKNIVNISLFVVLLICYAEALDWQGQVVIISSDTEEKCSAVLLTPRKIAVWAKAYEEIGKPTKILVSTTTRLQTIEVTPSPKTNSHFIVLITDKDIDGGTFVQFPAGNETLTNEIINLFAVPYTVTIPLNKLTIVDRSVQLESGLIGFTGYEKDDKYDVKCMEKIGDLVYDENRKILYGMVYAVRWDCTESTPLQMVLMSQSTVLDYLISQQNEPL